MLSSSSAMMPRVSTPSAGRTWIISSASRRPSPMPAPSSSSATTAPRRPSSRLRGRSSRIMSTRSPRMSSQRSLSVSLSPCMRRSRVTSKLSGSPTKCSAFIVMAIPTARWPSSTAPMRRAVPLSRSSAVLDSPSVSMADAHSLTTRRLWTSSLTSASWSMSWMKRLSCVSSTIPSEASATRQYSVCVRPPHSRACR